GHLRRLELRAVLADRDLDPRVFQVRQAVQGVIERQVWKATGRRGNKHGGAPPVQTASGRESGGGVEYRWPRRATRSSLRSAPSAQARQAATGRCREPRSTGVPRAHARIRSRLARGTYWIIPPSRRQRYDGWLSPATRARQLASIRMSLSTAT